MKLGILTDVYDFDFSKVNPKASRYDMSVQLANAAVDSWLTKPANRKHLHEMQVERMHDKGMSVGGNMKQVCDIPEEAFFLLPPEIRNHKEELMKWVRNHHPCLLFSGDKWNY